MSTIRVQLRGLIRFGRRRRSRNAARLLKWRSMQSGETGGGAPAARAMHVGQFLEKRSAQLTFVDRLQPGLFIPVVHQRPAHGARRAYPGRCQANLCHGYQGHSRAGG